MASTRQASAQDGLLARAPSGALVITAIASVQWGAAIAATLFARIGPSGAVALRLVSAMFVLVLIWRPRIRGRPARELLVAVSFGAVLAAMNLAFYEAVDRLPLGIAVTIEFVGPLAVAVGGSRRPLDFVWVLLAAAGIVELAHGGGGGGHGLDALGVAMAAGAGCCWAAYILLNAHIGRAFERGTGLSLAMAVAALIVLPVGIAHAGSRLLEPRTLALGCAVGLLSSAIPYSFENEALRRIAPSVFGVLMSLEPAIAALAGTIVLGQGLGARALAGIALVVVASVGASRRTSEAPLAV